MARRKEDLLTLQSFWYQRLIDDGFKDIEDTSLPGRPLKDWHSFKFISETTQARKALRSEYQEKADEFANASSFEEICALIVKHGNSRLEIPHIQMIWDLHVKGFTEREIAVNLRRSKTCIHLILERLRVWMNLV